MKINPLLLTLTLLSTVLLTGCHDKRYDHKKENCQQAHLEKLPANDKLKDLIGWCMTERMTDSSYTTTPTRTLYWKQ